MNIYTEAGEGIVSRGTFCPSDAGWEHVAAPAALGGRELSSAAARPPPSNSSLFASFCS